MANANPAVAIVPGIVFRPNCGIGVLSHSYVVVAVVNGTALTVNWTDIRNYEESTCQLDVGDHPTITKLSVMFYPRFKEFAIGVLGLSLANGNLLDRLDDLKQPVLERVIEGARRCPDLTDDTKRKFRLV